MMGDGKPQEHAGFIWRAMEETAARAIAGWRYAGAYRIYNTAEREIEAAAETLCAPQHRYFTVSSSEDGRLLGFFCLGEEAQVPGGDYSGEALDIGMGIHPGSLGRGLGRRILRLALDHAKREYVPSRFRATVAAFNERALRLCWGVGFTESATFFHPENQLTYVVLTRDAFRCTESHDVLSQGRFDRMGGVIVSEFCGEHEPSF